MLHYNTTRHYRSSLFADHRSHGVKFRGLPATEHFQRRRRSMLVRLSLGRSSLIAGAAQSVGTCDLVPKKRVVSLRTGCCSSPKSSGLRHWSVQYEESSHGAVALTNRLLCACGPERVFPSIVHTLTPSGRQVAQCAGSGVGRPCDELCRKRRLNSD